MGRNSKLSKVRVNENTVSAEPIKNHQAKPSKAPSKRETETPTPVSDHTLPIKLQQVLLDVFKDTFSEVLAASDLQASLQDIKSALYDRNFKLAFQERYLEAYAVRWSPSRALCYASILIELGERMGCLPWLSDAEEEQTGTTTNALRVVAFGGGAAEIVAFGGYLRYLKDPLDSSDSETCTAVPSRRHPSFDLRLMDFAQWGSVVQKLRQSIVTPPPLSRYASLAARESNQALGPVEFRPTFEVKDILDLNLAQLADLCGSKPLLVTLLFTLNELYTSSIARTTAFLLKLTECATDGSHLLVVDSPGSYSENVVGGEGRKYPMTWLMDHMLLDNNEGKSSPKWTKLRSEDSKWFRIAECLRYPIRLENMRYQLHLYRRQ